jgi:hypothetical protein
LGASSAGTGWGRGCGRRSVRRLRWRRYCGLP